MQDFFPSRSIIHCEIGENVKKRPLNLAGGGNDDVSIYTVCGSKSLKYPSVTEIFSKPSTMAG